MGAGEVDEVCVLEVDGCMGAWGCDVDSCCCQQSPLAMAIRNAGKLEIFLTNYIRKLRIFVYCHSTWMLSRRVMNERTNKKIYKEKQHIKRNKERKHTHLALF